MFDKFIKSVKSFFSAEPLKVQFEEMVLQDAVKEAPAEVKAEPVAAQVAVTDQITDAVTQTKPKRKPKADAGEVKVAEKKPRAPRKKKAE